MTPDMTVASRIAIAMLVGFGAGLEREWSGHASGGDARFGGIRTFSLLGLVGGIAGALAATSHDAVAAAIIVATGALCIAGYVVATRRLGSSTDGTTEGAALAVIALGVFAGTGQVGIAAGAGALVVFLLREKRRVHWLVSRLDEPELRAGIQFSVLAVVILPLLPEGPFLGALAVRPRSLWTVVLIFSLLNFAGFVARRMAGAKTGLAVAGALGGILSSTAVTLDFARQSRASRDAGGGLATGVLAACAVLVPRVVVVSAALNRAVALRLLPLLAPMLLVGATLVVVAWRSISRVEPLAAPASEVSPLNLREAMRMAVLFQIAIALVAVAQRYGDGAGLLTTASLLGLTDVDALTVSLSRSEVALTASTAARAIAVGVIANTLLKVVIAASLGRASFRRRAVAGLTCLAIGGGIGLLLG